MLDTRLRRRRKVPVRGRPLEYGARARGHAREQVPGSRGRDAARASQSRLLAAVVKDETADYIAICRLQSAYADVVNRRAWPELAPLFVAGAPVTVDTVTNPVVELEGADALGQFIAGA